MRWLVVLAVLFSGCLDPGVAPDAAGGTDGGTGPDPGADAGVPGRPATEVQGDGPPAGPVGPGGQETWYLHNVITCSGEPCNCGSHEFSMDRADTEGDCDGQGQRTLLASEWDDCKSACYPNGEPMGGFPVGSVVEGVVYLTTDAVDEVDVSVELVDGSGPLGAAEVTGVRVDGLAGSGFEAVGFRFELERPVTAERMRFVLGVRADVGYFVGYEDDHASHFRVTAPGEA